MSEWVEAAGYAEDYQAAYDYFKTRGGRATAERFVMRYRRCVKAIVAHPRHDDRGAGGGGAWPCAASPSAQGRDQGAWRAGAIMGPQYSGLLAGLSNARHLEPENRFR